MFKGDNVIVAYCSVCNKPITQADLDLGLVSDEDNNVIEYIVSYGPKIFHIHHQEKYKKMLEDGSHRLALLGCLERMPNELPTSSDIFKHAEKWLVTKEDLKYMINCFLSEVKVRE